jgi:hypothetical protein
MQYPQRAGWIRSCVLRMWAAAEGQSTGVCLGNLALQFSPDSLVEYRVA